MNKLEQAARALLAHWDTPAWKYLKPTGDLMADLRRALAEPMKQEPVACIALALEALIYHTQQTRPIQKTDEAIIYLQNVLNKQEQNMSFTLEDAIKKFPEISYWHSEFEKHNIITAPIAAKAIRAEALEEAAKWLAESGLIGSNDCAAAIRGMK